MDLITRPIVNNLKQSIDFDTQFDKQTHQEYSNNKEWFDDSETEGQLAVDIYETQKNLIVKSTIAGARSEDISIAINNDMLTIRGSRDAGEEISEEDYLYRECYWGAFSRSLILPVEIRSDQVKATMENGVLTIILPKLNKPEQVLIKVREKGENKKKVFKTKK